MLLQLKSNGTKHTVSKEVYDKMSRDTKKSYRVLNDTEEQVAENKTPNGTAKTIPSTGEKKEEVKK
jgi:hypothetical protein